ncbi:MAG: UvrD-helicase domain-containing protein, partial [bacterium]
MVQKSNKIDKLVNNLNPRQKQAVLHNHSKSGPLLILAGAGSGKTAVATRRITYLLITGAEPEAILALTFTKKAAEEMKERAVSLYEEFMGEPTEAVHNMHICTFHSLCLALLKESLNGKSNFSRLGFKRAPDLLHEKDCLKILGALYSGKFKNRSLPNIDEALYAIDKFVSFHGSPQVLKDSLPAEEQTLNIIELWECYIKEKLKCTGIDFSDMISLCIKLLEEHVEVLEFYRERFKYILIDEYQDTNIPQYKLSR